MLMEIVFADRIFYKLITKGNGLSKIVRVLIMRGIAISRKSMWVMVVIVVKMISIFQNVKLTMMLVS